MKINNVLIVVLSLCLVQIVGAKPKVVTSTAENQISVNVTVYNNNLGLVKDSREIKLPKGNGELRFEDVASHIMPATVYVKSLNNPKGFTVLEQNYEYDLMNENKLLDKYVGKKIKIIDYNKYKDRKEIIDAYLLSNNNGQIFKIGDEIFLGHPGIKVLPKMPENLIAEPTLMWLYENNSKKPRTLEVSYLTENINWKADYIFLLGSDELKTDLSGWVTLDNRSGATYKNAGLKLIAGDVHRVREEIKRHYEKGIGKLAVAPDYSGRFEEKEFFEYHMYTLPGKTTIKNNQSKQIRLLEASGIKAKKEFVVSATRKSFTYRSREGKKKEPVNVYMLFKNSKGNNLGMPLPMGIVRVYKRDTDKSQIFLGEDKIEHTPEDEEVRLKIGQAFDIVAERLQTDYVRVTSKVHESEWEITLRNHKKGSVTIGIVEQLQGSWKIIEKSQPYEKIDAFTIRFDVDIPAGKEVKVRYRVKVKI